MDGDGYRGKDTRPHTNPTQMSKPFDCRASLTPNVLRTMQLAYVFSSVVLN